ncbi:MAG TPA: DUF1652 domain-containing protein [Thermoanaerobaculia bacterium]|nr:DUF1652 domain-containing protein [Thermoanaerobaculia bacterium]
METTTAQERLTALAEAAFLPLETHASLEADGHYQIRVLDGSEAIHIEEMPESEVRDERDLEGWIERMRGRLEGMGYQLDPWERTAAALR